MKHEQVGVIYKTNDYNWFKFIDSNRPINTKHVRRLIDSFKKKYHQTVITINHKHEVIDGQHRLTAAKALGLPIFYTNGVDSDISDAQLINLNQVNWNKMNYLHSYCQQGKEQYLELKEFMSRFPDFGIMVATKIYTGLQRGDKFRCNSDKTGTEPSKTFETGDLEAGSITKAYSNAKKIMEFKEFYDGFSRNTFVTAILPLLNSDIYSQRRMISKLKICPTRLSHCANVKQYRYLLQEIYNYKSRDDRADFINL